MADPETTVPRTNFETAYTGRPPWDIDGPQPDLVAEADRITGRVLDAGCGTGENALFFASRGCTVTGFDFLAAPIQRAKEKAAIRNLNVTFLVKDARRLTDWNDQFDTVIDSGLFHVFSDEDMEQYVAGLHHVLKPGGRYYLLCFSDAEPGTQGPRRISKQAIYDRFREDWEVESITATHYRVRDEYRGERFSGEGAHAWFAVIRRV